MTIFLFTVVTLLKQKLSRFTHSFLNEVKQ